MTEHRKNRISVIIPCYCSEKYLESTVQGIITAFSKHPQYSLQLILVNDGSQDATFEVIKSLSSRYDYITGIDLDHGYGQGCAKMAGIRFITGEYAVFMDDDGQHDPDLIFSMINEAEKGADLVYARFDHMEESAWRKAASKVNDLVLSLVTKKPKGLTITSFFLISSRSIDYLKEQDHYAGSVGMTLFPVTDNVSRVKAAHLSRTEGTSGYTLGKLFKEWSRIMKGSRKTIPADMAKIRTVTGPDPRKK